MLYHSCAEWCPENGYCWAFGEILLKAGVCVGIWLVRMRPLQSYPDSWRTDLCPVLYPELWWWWRMFLPVCICTFPFVFLYSFQLLGFRVMSLSPECHVGTWKIGLVMLLTIYMAVCKCLECSLLFCIPLFSLDGVGFHILGMWLHTADGRSAFFVRNTDVCILTQFLQLPGLTFCKLQGI